MSTFNPVEAARQSAGNPSAEISSCFTQDIPLPRHLQANLTRHIAAGFEHNWVMQRVSAPLTEKDLSFLKSRTLADLVPQHQDQEGIAQLIKPLVTIFISQVILSAVRDEASLPGETTITVAEGRMEDEKIGPSSIQTQAGRVILRPSPSASSAMNASNTLSTPSSSGPSNAEGKFIQQQLGNQATSLGRKWIKEEVSRRILERYHITVTQLPAEFGAMHLAEGQKLSILAGKAIDVADTALSMGIKLREDFSREGLLQVILEKTKETVNGAVFDKIGHGIAHAAPLLWRAGLANGISIGLNLFFESPNLNENEEQMLRFNRMKPISFPQIRSYEEILSRRGTGSWLEPKASVASKADEESGCVIV